MILVEEGEPFLRNVHFVEEEDKEMLKETLDLTEDTIKKSPYDSQVIQEKGRKKIQQQSQTKKLPNK